MLPIVGHSPVPECNHAIREAGFVLGIVWAGQPEVRQLHGAFSVDEYVRRFEVTMEDPIVVAVGKSLQELLQDTLDLRGGEPHAVQPITCPRLTKHPSA